METPLISIALCTCNGSAYLREQIDSVLKQTYSNLEIIIVDDCSTDNTWEIVKEYESRDKRIRIYRNNTSLGINKNFELAVRKSNGEYVGFCDQDDIWKKNKIEILFATIQEYDLVYCDSEFIDKNGNSFNKRMSDIKNLKSFNSFLPFIIGNVISGHAILMRKSILVACLPFPDYILYDWYIAFYVSCFGKIGFTQIPLVKYRQHNDNYIAAIKTKGFKKKECMSEIAIIRKRLQLFYKLAYNSGLEYTTVIKKLCISYQKFSIVNNIRRSLIFWEYRKEILATKKRSEFRMFLFSVKMFFKIV